MPGEPTQVTRQEIWADVRRKSFFLREGWRLKAVVGLSVPAGVLGALLWFGEREEAKLEAIAIVAAWSVLMLWLLAEIGVRYVRARGDILTERLSRANDSIGRLEVQYHAAYNRVMDLLQQAQHLRVRPVLSDDGFISWRAEFLAWQESLQSLQPLFAKRDHWLQLMAPMDPSQAVSQNGHNEEHRAMKWELFLREQKLGWLAYSEYSRWSN